MTSLANISELDKKFEVDGSPKPVNTRSKESAEAVAKAEAASKEELKIIQRKLAGLKCKDSDARWAQKRILQLIPLILQGEDVNYSAPDMKGNTCLHYACELGSRQLIHWLVENGADVNRVEYGGGNTPLHNAARLASLHTVTYLLEHGAKPDTTNHAGQRPVDVVGRDDHDAICALLTAKSSSSITLKGIDTIRTLPEAVAYRQAHRVPLYPDDFEDFWDWNDRLYIVPNSADLEPLYSLEKGEEPIAYRYDFSDLAGDESLVVDDNTFLVTCSKAHTPRLGWRYAVRDPRNDNDSTINKSVTFWNPHTLQYVCSVMLASNWQFDWLYGEDSENNTILFYYTAQKEKEYENEVTAESWLSVDLQHNKVQSFYGNHDFADDVSWFNEMPAQMREKRVKRLIPELPFPKEAIKLTHNLLTARTAQANHPYAMQKMLTLDASSHDFVQRKNHSINALDFSDLSIHAVEKDATEFDLQQSLNTLPAAFHPHEKSAAQYSITGGGAWLSVSEGYVDDCMSIGICLFHPFTGKVIPLRGFLNSCIMASSYFMIDGREADIHPITCRLEDAFEGISEFVGFHAPFVYHPETKHYTFLLTEEEYKALSDEKMRNVDKEMSSSIMFVTANERHCEEKQTEIKVLMSRLNPHVVIKGHGQHPRGTLMSLMNHRPGRSKDSYYWLAADDGVCSLVAVDFANHRGEVVEHWEGNWRRQLRNEAESPEQPVWMPERRWLCLPYKPHCWKVLKIDESTLKTELKCYVYLHGPREYAVVLPNGLYAGSPGCERFLFIEQEGRKTGIAPLAAWHNRPGEVLEALGGNPDDIAALKQTTLRWLKRLGVDADAPEPSLQELPEITAEYPNVLTPAATCSFPVTAAAKNTGACKVRVLTDGVQVQETELAPAKTATLQVALNHGCNWIELLPRYVNGVEGAPVRFRVIREGTGHSRLFVVAVGVSEYEAENLRLQYAAKDAGDIAEGFRKFAEADAKILCLKDGEVKKASLLSHIRTFLASANSEDRVVLYCAGHGMLDTELNYFYAPSDFDPEQIADTGIAMEALQQTLMDCPARQRLLLLDTCHSGVLGEAGEEKMAMASGNLAPGVRAIQNRGMKVKAIPSMNRRQKKRYIEEIFSMGGTQRGINIIAGAAGAEYALESDTWNNGVFTATVLQALSGCGDSNMDGWLSVGELADYVSHKVRIATGGAQQPSVSAMENNGKMPLVANVGDALYRQDWKQAAAYLQKGAQLNDGESSVPHSWIGLAMEKNAPTSLLDALIKHKASVEKAHFNYWSLGDDYDAYFADEFDPYISVARPDLLKERKISLPYRKILAPYIIKKMARKGQHITTQQICSDETEYAFDYLSSTVSVKENNHGGFEPSWPSGAVSRDLSASDIQNLDTYIAAARRASETSRAAQLESIRGGGDIDGTYGDANGNTALCYAAYAGDAGLLRFLIDHGANVHVRNAEGWSPIILAVFKGRTECVRELLSAGASVEEQTPTGTRLLMLAAMFGHTDVIDVLLADGADINAKTSAGLTALKLAEQKGQKAAAAKLRSRGAK